MKSASSSKTNAARLLDSMGISYELRAYEVDPEDLTAISVARKIGLPLSRSSRPFSPTPIPANISFAVIPGDSELDLKN